MIRCLLSESVFEFEFHASYLIICCLRSSDIGNRIEPIADSSDEEECEYRPYPTSSSARITALAVRSTVTLLILASSSMFQCFRSFHR